MEYKNTTPEVVFLFMPRAGLEPARSCEHSPSNYCVCQFHHLGFFYFFSSSVGTSSVSVCGLFNSELHSTLSSSLLFILAFLPARSRI